MRYFSLLLVVLLSASQLSATTYYLDYDGGSNSNDGLSPATAWKDLFKIRNANPAPGDVFLFKRGSVWAGLQLYITASGTSAQPIRYGAYGSTQDDLPVITSVATISDALATANWSAAGSNIWSLPLSASPGRLLVDGNEVLRSSTLATLGQTDNAGATGVWFYDTTASLLYYYSVQNPATTFTDFAGSQLFYSALIAGASYTSCSEISFQGGSGAALAILGSTHVSIEDCELGRRGNSGILIGVLSGSASDAVTVDNNVFDSDFTFYYGDGSERGCGDGIRLRQGALNCEIRNNIFRNWAHNAIELLGDDGAVAGVSNNLIYDNLISAPDIPYAHPIGVDGYSGKCQNNEIYRNFASDCRTAAQLNGNDNWYHHNIFRRMRRSPSKPQATAHGIILGVYGANLVCENNRYDHNLITDTDEAGILIRGYGFSNQVSGNLLRNNVVYDTGKLPYNNDYDQGTGLIIYDTNQDGVGGNTYRNNLLRSSDPAVAPIYLQDDGFYYTATEFNQLDGLAANTVANNVGFDPRFENAGGGDYSPADNSQMINAGIMVGLTADFAQNARVVGPAPDIGPYESDLLAPLPVTWLKVVMECNAPVAVLDWSVLEWNNAYFQVERSEDGRNWQKLAQLPSKGDSQTENYYSYQLFDSDEANGYYRIQQVDWDGTSTYSPIVSCESLIKAEQAIQLVGMGNGRFRLALSPEINLAEIQLTAFDYSGKALRFYQEGLSLDLSHLPAGSYLLLVQSPTERFTFSVILP